MIDSNTLASAIQTQITGTVERSVQDYVENIVRALAMDQAWIAKIEKEINESIARRFGQKLSLIDVNSVVADAIEPAVAKYFERRKAQGHGIEDLSQETELTITSGQVDVSNQLRTNHLRVETDADIKQNLTVKNLVVKGTINTDNHSWQELSAGIARQVTDNITQEWRDHLIKTVVTQIQEHGISFDNVKIGDSPLVDQDTLAPAIRRSNLKEVGVLDHLQVSGSADISRSLAVRPHRVGINTQHPDMALAVWDEEVALVFGKHKEQTAYVGTLRPQSMVIGINRATAIAINEKGQVTIPHLTVGRHRICHEPECPNYSGTKGDIVFNSNPKNDGVWGWQCQGAFRWVPLRSA